MRINSNLKIMRSTSRIKFGGMGNLEIIFSETSLMKDLKLKTLSRYWEKFPPQGIESPENFPESTFDSSFLFLRQLGNSSTVKWKRGMEAKFHLCYAKEKLSLKIRTRCPIIPQQRRKMRNWCIQSGAYLSKFVLVLPQAMLIPSLFPTPM